MKNTLLYWTAHKGLLWVTHFNKLKILYATGKGEKLVLYDDDFNCLTTCIDDDKWDKYNHLWKAPIKYIIDAEDDKLIIQLWNTKKLNKIYGVENQR